MCIERICWNITNECNDNCEFCFRDNLSRPLSLECNLKIAKKILDAGIQHIAFSGGEPLLYNGIFEIMDFIKRRGVQITLISNCILLNQEVLDKCLKYIDWLAVPIDTINVDGIKTRNIKHIQDVENVLNYVEYFKKCNIKINSVVSKMNYMEISDIYKEIILKYKCIKRWNLFEFTPARGKARKNEKFYQLSLDENNKVIEQLNGLNIIRNDLSIKFKHKETILNSYFVISPNGDITRLEGNEQIVVGNILSESFNYLLDKINIDYELYKKRVNNEQLIII